MFKTVQVIKIPEDETRIINYLMSQLYGAFINSLTAIAKTANIDNPA